MTTIEFQSNLIDLQDSLMRFAYSLTADRNDAKDLVQDTSLKALKYCDKFVNETNFKAWAYTIMKNTFINDYRRGIRHNMYCDRTNDSVIINRNESMRSENPDSIYSTQEIIHNIELLKEKLRVPFKMHISGYKYKEIADTLNLKIGTVKSRIFISRKQLMDQLER